MTNRNWLHKRRRTREDQVLLPEVEVLLHLEDRSQQLLLQVLATVARKASNRLQIRGLPRAQRLRGPVRIRLLVLDSPPTCGAKEALWVVEVADDREVLALVLEVQGVLEVVLVGLEHLVV